MRLHLFEFNDQPWLPEVLRRHAAGLLATIFARCRSPGWRPCETASSPACAPS